VMGLASDSQALAFQRDAFAERYQVVAFDNRDAGRSERASEDYRVADLAQDALALADALGLGTFHLLGISLGSAAAQHVALAAPERVRTLTLAATWARFAPAWARLRARTWEREATRGSREELLEEFMLLTTTEPLFEDEDAVEAMKQGALDDPHPQELDALVRQMRAFEHHDTLDRLPELTVPTHVIAGDRDLLIPPWKGEEVAQRIPGATLTVLRGAGHAMNAERAPEFNAAVLAFLDANS
jgi:3-oxoadipate enol-lactonase